MRLLSTPRKQKSLITESLCVPSKLKTKNVDMQKKYFNMQQNNIDIPVITIE